MFSSDRPDWSIEGRNWPNRSWSRFVEAAGLRWHVQAAGAGPSLLLVHGTGASNHSWRDLAPLLAEDFSIVAPDLPGHGFTDSPERGSPSLSATAANLGALLKVLGVADTAIAVGHSAGAAILIRMTLDGIIAPKLIVSLCGALLPFRGFAGAFFAPLARLLFVNPFVPRFFSWRADEAAIDRLIRNTGSKLDAEGIALYTALFRHSAHTRAALGMMANWDLETLVGDLTRLHTKLLLVAAGGDRAVPADNAFVVRDLVTGARVEYVRGAGHLAHEEQPDVIAAIIRGAARQAGALPDTGPGR